VLQLLYGSCYTAENEIVKMFLVHNPAPDSPISSSGKKNCSRMLDERFIRILKIFKWGPDAEKALEVLKLKVDNRLVCEVLKIDVDIRVKVQFFNWAGKMRNFQHDSTIYMALIYCLLEAGLVGELWKTVQDFARSPCFISPSEFSEIVRILGQAKMVNKAISVFYQIKGRKCKPTANTYNSIILMLMQEGQYEKMHEIYNEMCNDGNCFPDTITYGTSIQAFGKLGRDESALMLFDEMKENGLLPNAKIYTTVLAIYFKLAKADKALDLVREMKEKGCPLTVYTYTELIKGLGKMGRVDEAYNTFSKMLKDGCKPDVVLMNNLINILASQVVSMRLVSCFEKWNLCTVSQMWLPITL